MLSVTLLHPWLTLRVAIGAAVMQRLDSSNDLTTRPFPMAYYI